jgi:sortase A
MKIKGKRILEKKHLRIVLYAAAGALLLAAAAILIVQWQEGEKAARSAEALLAQSSIRPDQSASALLAADGTYLQPEQPDAQTEDEITKMLETDLQGYTVIARLDIEKLGLHLPVLSGTSDKALTVSVCFYEGPDPGGKGNLVITGHNYRNGAHFGNLDKMAVGDTVMLTGISGKTYIYTVYKLERITPDNPGALDKTQDPAELTLLTCDARGNQRLLVRCTLTDNPANI